MAGSKGSKYFDIFLHYKVWLNSNSKPGLLSDDVVRLLERIDQLGSLKEASLAEKLSYRKAWGDIQKAEDFVGFTLVETTRGGKDGGLSVLTDDGHELVKAFNALHEQFNEATHRITRQFFHKLNKDQEKEDE